MKNKGFTLIELLAVIVILAIIALIATPIVLNIINESQESAKVNSAQFVIDGVQTAYGVAYSKTYTANGDITAKSAGQIPSTYHIANELNFKNVESVNKTATSITVVTKDNVTCTFTKDTDNKLKSDNCGNLAGITATDIGEVK